MICTTIQGKNFEEICELLDSCEMAEIRLDRCGLTMQEMEDLFSSEIPLVATCRIEEMKHRADTLQGSPEEECESRLAAAIEAGASFVDVEMEAPRQMMKRLREAAHKFGTVFIVSSHDFVKTGSYSELQATAETCFRYGADVAKVVTTAVGGDDPQRVAALYEDFNPANLIAFCMGEAGRDSRVECLRLGARYTYAALSEDEAAAPGQWPANEMMKAVYGDRKFFGRDYSEPDGNVFGYGSQEEVRMPSSKSFAQRAVLAAALAAGTSRLSGYTPCGDTEAALSVAKSLGAKVSVRESVDKRGSDLIIRGVAAAPGSVDLRKLNVGESGLLTRLMIPLSSILSPSDTALQGEGTLCSRPLRGAADMMKTFGVRVSSEKMPLTVSGNLLPCEAEVDGANGSQLISGLLMAEPLAAGNSTVSVLDPKSIPYMFITLDVLKRFGISVRSEMNGEGELPEFEGDWSGVTDITFKIRGNQRYKAAEIDLEGDWSAAANFLVAGAIFGGATVTGLDTKSLQADLSVMDILIDAGANPVQLDDDYGPIVIRRTPLTAFETDASNCPDLFPILSVLAAFCQGTSRIAGVNRLAHKESDRGAAIVEMMTAMGVPTKIEGNTLVVEGRSLACRCLTGTLLKGGTYSSRHDHRVAMALKVAGLGADSPIVIDDEDCVAKSFPTFFDLFDKLA